MNQNAVYIIPRAPIFNTEHLNVFENLSKEDSIFLRSTLYLNIIENFLSKESLTDFYFYLDESDKDFIPEDFTYKGMTLNFFNYKDLNKFVENLSAKEFSTHKKNIVISSDLIGITLSDLDKFFNLLSIEDESLLIGKANNGEIGYLGFNNYSNDIFYSLVTSDFIFDNFLSKIKTSLHFIYTFDNILLIKNTQSFKELYLALSQRKSIEYCSHELHERFTHLFIEYKELLK